MAPHPTGETVEIVGISASTSGRQCEHHAYCGVVLEEDVLVRLRKVQVIREIKEETAIAAVWVSDGVEQCRVGFLPRSYVKHSKKYDGALAQVIELYKDSSNPAKCQKSHRNYGIALAAMLSYDDTEVKPTTMTTTTATSPTASGSNKKRLTMAYFITRSPSSRKKPQSQTTNSQPNNNNNNTTATDEREEEKNNQSSSNDNNEE